MIYNHQFADTNIIILVHLHHNFSAKYLNNINMINFNHINVNFN